MRLVAGERLKESRMKGYPPFPVDILECGHELRKPIIDSTADWISAAFPPARQEAVQAPLLEVWRDHAGKLKE